MCLKDERVKSSSKRLRELSENPNQIVHGGGVGTPLGRDVLEQRRGGRGSGTQKFVYQKWAKSILPFAKFHLILR